MSGKACLLVRKGEPVEYQGQAYVITSLIGLDQVVVRHLVSGERSTVDIQCLKPPKTKAESSLEGVDIDLETVSEADWDVAKSRFNAILPLLGVGHRGGALAKQAAKELGVAFKTVYRWREAFLGSGLLSSLLPAKPPGGTGKGRLKDRDVEHITQTCIEEKFLNGHQYSVAAIHDEIEIRCNAAGRKAPAYNTILNRVNKLDPRTVTAKRYGERAAVMLHDVNKRSIPDAEWPLAMVQMDHTLLPISLVDETFRQPIGRAWVTLDIDVYSRVIPGMYVTLDAPSAMSAGMCVSRSILSKEEWLSSVGIDAPWPVWGVMGILHMDNAREFRGNMLRAACQEYNIDLHLRPVKKPHYGAHIERLMGTFSQELKVVPGTTFSGPKEKGEYDSEENAIMTLAELERWLITLIAKYHNQKHSALGMTPLQKFREGCLGTPGKPGRGLPPRRLDAEKVCIDFMPYTERGIHEYGVMFCGLHYYADVLRPWMNMKDEKHKKSARQYRFRYDPRDISVLYFFEPNAKRYFPVPFRDLSKPPISLWEVREAKKMAKQDGVPIDEETTFGYARKMRDIAEGAAEKTKAARKAKQKRTEHQKSRSENKIRLPKASAVPPPTAPPSVIAGYNPNLVTAFDDD